MIAVEKSCACLGQTKILRFVSRLLPLFPLNWSPLCFSQVGVHTDKPPWGGCFRAQGVYVGVTYGWQSLTRSWSVVPGWRPRMYRLVLLSCSPPPLPLLMEVVMGLVLLPLLLLLLFGLGGAIWWLEGDTYVCCRTGWRRDQMENSARITAKCPFLLHPLLSSTMLNILQNVQQKQHFIITH